jgi:hypothetical protein
MDRQSGSPFHAAMVARTSAVPVSVLPTATPMRLIPKSKESTVLAGGAIISLVA